MKKNKKKKTKYSSRLTPEEIRQYEAMGEIDYDQDHLEIFSDAIIQQLIDIKDGKGMRDSSNHEKADIICKFLGSYGFVEIDVGTNIYVMAHHQYPGVVFKIALDDCGVADNFNDVYLQDYIEKLCRTIAIHPTGMVSVQERKVIFRTPNRIKRFIPEIRQMLKSLSKMFVLVDVSPLSIRNYYIDRDGTIGLADASDIYQIPANYNIFKCRNVVDTKQNGKPVYCGGNLEYDHLYYELICKKCGKHYNPFTLRRTKKEEMKMQLISTGLNAGEWDALNAICYSIRNDKYSPDAQKASRNPFVSSAVEDKVDAVDDDEDDVRESEVFQKLIPKVEEPNDNDTVVLRKKTVVAVAEEESVERVQVSEPEVEDDPDYSVLDMNSDDISDGECRVTLVTDPDTDMTDINITTNSKNLVNTLREAGPEIYLSNRGGNYTKVMSAELLAAVIERQIADLTEAGLWDDEID